MADSTSNQPNKNDQYFITIKRGLLEDKHRQAMQISQKTTALWMYLWFLDKITSIDTQSSLGMVNFGHPQKLEFIAKQLHTDIKTARKMFHVLHKNGYIEVERRKYGQVVYVTKAFKIFGQRVPDDGQYIESVSTDHVEVPQRGRSETPKVQNLVGLDAEKSTNLVGLEITPVTTPVNEESKSGRSYYYNNNYKTNITNNSTNVELGDKKLSPAKEHRENVSKLYYQAIKALDLPVRNHTNVKAKINELARDQDKEKIINYLTFIRDQYAEVDWQYKPHLSEALDIHDKRGKIRETFKRHVQGNRTKGIKL